MKFYSVWCEWGIGQDGLLFTTKWRALRWLRSHPVLEDCMAGDVDKTDKKAVREEYRILLTDYCSFGQCEVIS